MQLYEALTEANQSLTVPRKRPHLELVDLAQNLPTGQYARIMALARARGGRRGMTRYRGRRRTYRKKKSFAARVKKIAFTVAEKKYKDIVMADAAQLTGGTATLLNGLQQGTSDSTRIGHRVTVVQIDVSLFCYGVAGASAPGQGDNMICMVIQDRDNKRASSFSITDMFTAANVIQAQRVASSMSRFRQISLHGAAVSPTSAAGVAATTVTPPVPIRFSKRVNIPVEYLGNVGDSTDIQKNALWLYCATQVSGSSFRMAGTIRVWYRDA